MPPALVFLLASLSPLWPRMQSRAISKDLSLYRAVLSYSSPATKPSQLLHTFTPTWPIFQTHSYKPLYSSLNPYYICRLAWFLLLSVPSLIFWINLSQVLSVRGVSSKNQLLTWMILSLYFLILLLSSLLSSSCCLKIYSAFYYVKLSAYLIF